MDPEKISIPLHPEIRQRGVFPDPGYRSKTGNQLEDGKDVESCLQYLEKLRQYQ